MDTVVVQSYRTADVPPWIARCLASVRVWAEARGYAYRFIGDEIFDLVPPAYLARTRHALPIVVDLARLLLAQRAHAEGYRRAIWLDADVLVFAPDRLAIPDERDFYLCRELWLSGFAVSRRVNNCACAFTAGTPFLPFYIAACQQLVRDAVGALDPLIAGTRFLTELDRALPLPQLDGVGLFGPAVVRDLAAGGGPYLEALRRASGPLHAVNLCASFRGKRFRAPEPFVLDDDVYARAVDALEAGVCG